MPSKIKSDRIEFGGSSVNPSNPVNGQVYYNTTTSKLRQYVGDDWSDIDVGDSGFKYRQVITTGYVMGGYKSGSPWKNINRMVHSTDVMTNLGDKLVYSASYSSAAGSLNIGWMFAAANAHSTATTNVVAFNMITETGRAANGSNYMATARNDAGAIWKEHQYAHIMSGGTTDKFNFTTETSTLSGLSIIADGTGAGVQGIVDENHALLYGDNTGQMLTFATSTLSSGVSAGNNNQQKPINSKVRKGYAGHEGTYNGGNNFRVTDLVTNSRTKTVPKPLTNSGEENYDMGQDHQYCMGQYNGVQNNLGHKFYYATDSGTSLGAGSVRTGVAGGSSGGCVWKG